MHSRASPRACLVAMTLAAGCTLLAAPSAAIVPPRDCGTLVVKSKRYTIKADQLRCRNARSHSSSYLSTRLRPSGYSCRNFGSDTKLKFRCARGVRVFFAIRR